MLLFAVLMGLPASDAPAHSIDMDCADFDFQAAAQGHRDVHARDPDRLDSDNDGTAAKNCRPCVHEIAIPAIVACGELQVALKVGRSTALADALPNGTYRLLPGRAHLPCLEAADEIAALILAEAL